jgi:cytoskeletal protein CcmA (bactofilin family)
VNAEISARDVVVHGDVNGNVVAQDRVEIKNHASVVGDIKAARISIEDGAHCKGRIEIERGKSSSSSFSESHAVSELVPVGAN